MVNSNLGIMAGLLLCLLVNATAAADDGWVSLFDGKTLTGWHVKCKKADKGKTFWKVEDGAIICNATRKHGYMWLMSDKEYGDFELKLKVKGFKDSKGNSGIQVRSRYDDKAEYLDGPQVDIHPPGGWRTGLIYDETRTAKRWISPLKKNWSIKPADGPKKWKWNEDDWNEIYIKCEGLKIFTKVNGYVISDYDGQGMLNDAGHKKYNVGIVGQLALQLHKSNQLHVAFKDIFIRPLKK